MEIANLKENVKTIVKGDCSKKTMFRFYLPAITAVLIFTLFLSWIFYPENSSYPYDWTTSTISRLGWPEENPLGYMFFSIGMSMYGLLSLPLVPFYYKKYSKINDGQARNIAVLMIAYSTSILLIGAIPFYTEPTIFLTIHAINALIIFIGFYIMTFLIIWMIIKESYLEKESKIQVSKPLFLLYIILALYGTTCLALAGACLPEGHSGHYYHDLSIPFYLSAPFYEWQTFICILLLAYIQVLLIPEEICVDEDLNLK